MTRLTSSLRSFLTPRANSKRIFMSATPILTRAPEDSEPSDGVGCTKKTRSAPEMIEDLRGVYLPPLRDAALGLRPSRSSQLARLLHILADDAGKLGIDGALKKLDEELGQHPPLVNVQAAITDQHSGKMAGAQLAQALKVGLSASDFKRFSSWLLLMVDTFEIEQNGLWI